MLDTAIPAFAVPKPAWQPCGPSAARAPKTPIRRESERNQLRWLTGLSLVTCMAKREAQREAQREAPEAKLGDLTNYKVLLTKLKVVAEQARPAAAVQLFEDALPRLQPERLKRPFLWNCVLAAYGKAGDYEGALAWYARMEAHASPWKKTFGKMMEAAARAGKPGEALRWMRQMEDFLSKPCDPEAFGILIYAHAVAGDPKAARACLQEKIRRYGQASLIDYNTVADAFASSGQGEKVQPLLQEAEAANLSLDKTSYTVLLTAQARSTKARGLDGLGLIC